MGPHHSKTSDIESSQDPLDPALEKELGIKQVVVPVPPLPAKEGGLRAWLQVVGCCFVFFNVWGLSFAFGLFQSFYEEHSLANQSASTISWIGTISSYLLIVTGVVSGPLFDLGHYRTMLFGGALVSCFGIFMLSLSKKYYQIILTQGVLIGLGCGVLFIPGMALVSRSFTRRRAVALGAISCGAPFGGIIYTVVFQSMINKVGFDWTVRTMGFIMLGLYLVAFPLLLWGSTNTGDISAGTTRKLFDRTALKETGFWLYTWANFFIFTGYLVPFFYMPTFAQNELGTSQALANYSIIISQGSSILGRMMFAFLALRTGAMVPWLVCVFVSAILCFAWAGVHSIAAFCVFAALYGFFSGALIPLPPSLFPVVCPDPKVLGTRLGMAQAVGATASLIGSPIAGAILGADGKNYLGLQLFCGFVMLAGNILQLSLWYFLVKKRQCKVFI